MIKWHKSPGTRRLEPVDLNTLAMQMAKKFDAVDSAGKVWCIWCNQREGVLPSLLCPGCLERWRAGGRIGA